MSKHAFEAFRAKLLEDPRLRAELQHALSPLGSDMTASLERVVTFARGCGYEFDVKHVPRDTELGDEDLETVAGGTDKYSRVKVQFSWI